MDVFAGVDAGWASALAPVRNQVADLFAKLYRPQSSANMPAVLPPRDQVLRAFTYPFAQVRVLILGQDPYPTPGHAHGLAFSVDRMVRPLPRSLRNIFVELSADLNVPIPACGDLTAWAQQGVCLLNTVLTVPAGQADGHAALGWQKVSEQAIRALAARADQPLVAVLWGKAAQRSAGDLLDRTPKVVSAHPSPLSARRGFFGSRPFSRVNEFLAVQGAPGIDWALP